MSAPQVGSEMALNIQKQPSLATKPPTGTLDTIFEDVGGNVKMAVVNDAKAIENLESLNRGMANVKKVMTSTSGATQPQPLHTMIVMDGEMKMGDETKMLNSKDIGAGVMENMDEMVRQYDYHYDGSHEDGGYEYDGEGRNVKGGEEDLTKASSHGFGYGGYGYGGVYGYGGPIYDNFGFPYIIKPCHKLFGCKFNKWFW